MLYTKTKYFTLSTFLIKLWGQIFLHLGFFKNYYIFLNKTVRKLQNYLKESITNIVKIKIHFLDTFVLK